MLATGLLRLGDRILSLGEGLPGLYHRAEGGAHSTGRADRLAKQRKNSDSTVGVFVSGCISNASPAYCMKMGKTFPNGEDKVKHR